MESNEDAIVVCGGTFDHFHKGHRDFLSAVFSLGNKAVIGVTTDEYISRSQQKSEKEEIEPYYVRRRSVESYIQSSGRTDSVIELSDIFGPTLDSEHNFLALVVSELTEKGAEIINSERKKKGLWQLRVVVVPLTKAQDGKPISSTRIRNGEITREGILTIDPAWFQEARLLPSSLRSELAKPFGPTIANVGEWIKDHDSKTVVLVGDVVTQTFNAQRFRQILSIVDFYVARKRKHQTVNDLSFEPSIKTVPIKNPAGTLCPPLFTSIDSFFKAEKREQTVFVIDGEEDLAVLPSILRAPLGFTIVYGQPGEGMIGVPVTEETKKKAYNFVKSFTAESL